MKEKEISLCSGLGCALKEQCARYKENIDVKTEVHFAFAPIKYSNGVPKCEFIIKK